MKGVICEFKKIFTSAGLWISIALMLLLMLTYVIYENETGQTYTVINALFKLDKEQMLWNKLSAQKVFKDVCMNSLVMYGPALAALSSATTICMENKFNITRYMLIRSGKWKYIFIKTVVALITSGIAFLAASIICLLVVMIGFPDMSELDDYEFYYELYSKSSDGKKLLLFSVFGIKAIYIYQLTGIFIYGSFCGAIGFMFTSFCNDVYLCVCGAFFGGYIYYSVYNGIIQGYISGNVSDEIANILMNYGNWSNYITFYNYTKSLPVNMLIYIVFWVSGGILYRIKISVKQDCGGKS